MKTALKKTSIDNRIISQIKKIVEVNDFSKKKCIGEIIQEEKERQLKLGNDFEPQVLLSKEDKGTKM